MAIIKFGNNTDFNNFEARNLHVETVSTLPAATTANTGRVVYSSKDERFYVCNGTEWVLPATDADQLQGKDPSYYLNRANQTGTQTASTISDFASVVKGYRISDFASANEPVDFGGNRILNVGDGTIASDGVNKGQLDQVANIANSAALGVSIKEPVKTAATTEIQLTGTTNIEGTSIAAGDRVLATAQSNPADNGIYVVADGAWARSKDADEAGELKPGTMVADYTNDIIWVLTSTGSITPGTSPQNWTKFIASSQIEGGEGIKVAGNTISIDPGVVPARVVVDVPAGSESANITHNLNSQFVTYQVFETATKAAVIVDYTATSLNSGVLDFGVAPQQGQYKAIFVG